MCPDLQTRFRKVRACILCRHVHSCDEQAEDVERNPRLASEWTSGPRRLGTPAGQLQDWAEGRQRWGPGVVVLGLLGQWGPVGRP